MKLRCRIGAFCFLLFQKLDSVLSLNAARVESYWPLAFGYKLMAENGAGRTRSWVLQAVRIAHSEQFSR